MKINIFLITLVVLTMAACGNSKQQNQESETQSQPETKAANEEASASSSSAMNNHPGKKVYNSICLACHMADGSGVPGMHPPLIETEWVSGDKERLIDLVLNGMEGKIEVNGETYNSIMPPNSHLTDQQIADVLTYIRKSFGNNSSEITKAEVAKVRNAE